jgi:hypothetical protein
VSGSTGPGGRSGSFVVGFATGDIVERLEALNLIVSVVTKSCLSTKTPGIVKASGVAVTTRDGKINTGAGMPMDTTGLLRSFSPCDGSLVHQLTAAPQVTVVDPVWNQRHRLWERLAEVHG